MKLTTYFGFSSQNTPASLTALAMLGVGLALAGCGDDDGGADVSSTSEAMGDAGAESEGESSEGSNAEETTDEESADTDTADDEAESEASDTATGGDGEVDSQNLTDVNTDEDMDAMTEEVVEPSNSTSNTSNPIIDVDTGIPGDTKLNELSEEEMQELCEALGAELNGGALTEYMCEFQSAISAATTVQDPEEFTAMCQAAAADCIEMSMPDQSDLDCANAEPLPDDCDATIDDYESCLNASFAIFPDVSCEDEPADVLAALVGIAALGESGGGLAMSPECDRVNACTELTSTTMAAP